MARRKPALSWIEKQALSKIVNDEGYEKIAAEAQVSTTTLSRWCTGIVGPLGFERDRLDAIFSKRGVKIKKAAEAKS